MVCHRLRSKSGFGGRPDDPPQRTKGLSYREVEERLAELGVTVGHVTIYRWIQRFTPEFVEAARTCRHVPGDRWFVDETYIKVNGRWTYLYRAVDQFGQVIDVWLSARRDLSAARTFFTRALATGVVPVEVTTDRAPAYPRVRDELVPAARHDTGRYANNRVEAGHGRLKARLRPMLRWQQRLRLGLLDDARVRADADPQSAGSDASVPGSGWRRLLL